MSVRENPMLTDVVYITNPDFILSRDMSWLTINVISRECTFHMNGLYNTFSHEWNRDKLKVCYRELYLFYSRNVNIKWIMLCNCDEVEKYVLWHHDNELLFYIRHIRFISRTNARMSLLFI